MVQILRCHVGKKSGRNTTTDTPAPHAGDWRSRADILNARAPSGRDGTPLRIENDRRVISGIIRLALVKMGAGSNNLRAAHDAMKAKALTLTWLKTFFDGNSEDEPREFDGLNVRLGGTTQEINAATGGATLTLDMLDEAIDAVQGTPDLLLMNKVMRRKVNKLIRAAGQATEVVSDAFGRQIMSYGGIPIGVVGDDAGGNAILDFDEDDGSGNDDTTSIYAVRFGLDALHGIQTEPMSVRDLGELNSKPAYRTRIECTPAR